MYWQSFSEKREAVLPVYLRKRKMVWDWLFTCTPRNSSLSDTTSFSSYEKIRSLVRIRWSRNIGRDEHRWKTDRYPLWHKDRCRGNTFFHTLNGKKRDVKVAEYREREGTGSRGERKGGIQALFIRLSLMSWNLSQLEIHQNTSWWRTKKSKKCDIFGYSV